MMQEGGYNSAYSPNYVTETVTTATTTAATREVYARTEGIGFQKGYLRTIPAIIKYVEIIASLVAGICVSVYPANWESEGRFCAFVGYGACITVIVWFLFYLFNIVCKFHPIMVLVELIYYAVEVVLYVIAWIVAVNHAATYWNRDMYAAFAVFGTVALIAFAVDCVLQFRKWRESRSGTSSGTSNTQAQSSGEHHSNEGAKDTYHETVGY